MTERLLQINMNHARRAHDLMLQVMDERGISLALVSEPYGIPAGNPSWVGSADGTAAIMQRRTTSPRPFNKVQAGDGYVVARWGEIYLVSVYLPPSLSRSDVEDRLEALSAAIDAPASEGAPIIIAGDFNAHSVAWGSTRTSARGVLIMDWAAEMGLACMNLGRASTCVRAQGESIVDLTWASPSAARMFEEWTVLDGLESMSDHVYIGYTLTIPGGPRRRERGDRAGRRWSTRKFDPDRMTAALLARFWPQEREDDPPRRLENRARDLRDAISEACDFAMPRARPRPKKAMYWWSAEIESLRRQAIRTRRVWTRSRQRGCHPEVVEANRHEYKEDKKALGTAISRAKAKAWEELLSDLNEDPWGLAYKLVRGKLRKWSDRKSVV